MHTVREREKNYTLDQNDPDVVQPYAAYSPNGTAKVKYCHSQSKAYLELSVHITQTLQFMKVWDM